MLKILLIDDDDDLLEITERRLLKKGFEVTAVASLAAARQKQANVPTGTFGAVISDLFLKGENGLTFFEHLKAEGFQGSFILTTGNADGDPRIPFHLASSQGFFCLEKPYPFENLLNILAHPSARSA